MAWSFGGVSFAVVSEGAIESEWFTARVERTVDVIAGTGEVIVDIGATVREPLGVVAQFTSKTTRANLEAKLGIRGTLSDDDGRSVTAMLCKATPVRVQKKDSGIYRLILEFEYLS